MSPAISILIRTFNSAGTLPQVLARLHLQQEDELIIVDSGSSDATLAVAKQYHARIAHAEPPFNYSRSLNIGFRMATNAWVLVISSHCVPLTEKLLETFRIALRQFPATAAVAYGECQLVDCAELEALPLLFADRSASPFLRHQVFGGNGLALYRRDRWQAQPFDETLPTGEDLAWFFNILDRGDWAVRVPQARVLYRNQGSLRHMFRKGWLEARAAAFIAHAPAMSWWQLGINWGSLLKKWVAGKLPASTLMRQLAHGLGACLSSNFSRR